MGVSCNASAALRPKATPSVSRLRRETARGRHGRREGAFCCTAGTVRHGKEICGRKILPNYMDLLRTRLPREGAAERLRELPFNAHRDRRVALRGSCHRPHQGHNDAASTPEKSRCTILLYSGFSFISTENRRISAECFYFLDARKSDACLFSSSRILFRPAFSSCFLYSS